MNPPHLLIIGCGDVGTRVGVQLQEAGWRVTGLRRDPSKLPTGFKGLAGDYTHDGGLAALDGLQADFCLFTPLPAGRDPAGYDRGFHQPVGEMARYLSGSGLHHAFYVSSTRVYAEADGGAVDECSPTSTTDEAALAILAGESAARRQFPTTVVRPSGLYGRGPGMLLERIAAGVASADADRISNRIHRDDLAGLLQHLLVSAALKQSLPETINATDDRPTPIGEVELWLADALGVTLTSSRTSTRQTSSRAITNKLLHETGYVLRYPDWRAGYAPLIDAWRANPD